ncbi:MAG: hypothetical protein II882_03185 [Lachnospiraceae bacterium]|nr:hypothetical protein [Lachnospiraceae bacterium]
MSTSDISRGRRRLLRHAILFLAAALITAFVGAVYERFAHSVYSYYMIYAFAIPLGLGTLPLLLFVQKNWRMPPRFTVNTWYAGVATLTVGSIFKGVLDIFGTTKKLLIVYPVAGGILLLLGAGSYILAGKKQERRNSA